jgi:hypothetical protein
MKHPFQLKNAALLMALSAIYPVQSYGAAGIAQFAVGDVNVRRDQAVIPLNRGQRIESGDQVITGRSGQTQIRFSDGGLVSLAPNSQFNIDRYADENKPEDGFFASLLRGGMRAITGLVGKRNRENYKISTSTATIGIRGSAFSANYNPDGSLNVAGEQDGIVVCTNAGCVELIVGEVVRVTGSDQLPVRTSERSNVPPLVVAQDLFVPENPAVIQLVTIPQPEAQELRINGVLTGVSAMFAFGDGSIDSAPRGGVNPSTGEATFVDSELVRHVGLSGGLQFAQPVSTIDTVEKTSVQSGTFGVVGTADDPALIGWGYWDTGRITYGSTGQAQPEADSAFDQSHGVHYLVGRPTAQAQMPVTGTASYSLIGATAPTAFDSELQMLRVGTLNSAGLNVDFGMGRFNAFVNTTFTGPDGSVAVQISGLGFVSGSSFYSDTSGDGYYYGSGGSFYGFFTGDQAARAGYVYRGYDDTLGSIDGSAVFLKSGTGQAFTMQSGVSALFASEYTHDYYPRGGYTNSPDASVGTGYFIGNQLYLHDDGEDSNGGYSYGPAGYLAANSPVSSFGSIGNAADADFIGWGYWAKASDNGSSSLSDVHYVVGRPTPQAQMPMTGVATYSMVGGTSPTASTYGGASITGRLLGATMTADFLNGQASASISTDFVKNGVTIPVTIQDNSISFSSANGAGFCGPNVSGFFTGTQATRAGLTYQKYVDSNLGTVRGAVGLQRGAITPNPP